MLRHNPTAVNRRAPRARDGTPPASARGCRMGGVPALPPARPKEAAMLQSDLYREPRRHALGAEVSLLLALAVPLAHGTTHTVLTCDDAGAGSLRAVVTDALTHSGDNVDLSTLNCSTISLTTGAILVAQDNLTVLGPGANQLSIERGPPFNKQRIFKHTGSGTLALAYLQVANGYYGGTQGSLAEGGCIRSSGNVSLDHVRVTGCQLVAKDEAVGGGVFATGKLTLKRATLSGNSATVTAAAIYGADGGGAWAHEVDASVSTISGNLAVGTLSSIGGGLSTRYLTLTASTIADNVAAGYGGAVIMFRCSNLTCIEAGSATIKNSTISGNSANFVGGIYARIGSLEIDNSTIVRNVAQYGAKILNGTFRYLAAGVFSAGGNVDLESSLLANNRYGSPPLDSDFSFYKQFQMDAVIGLDNLVREGHGAAPSGSLHGACPLLGPLRDNGGVTNTHALLSGSPGIDAGNNAADLTYDQRLAPNVRDNGFPDIGAYEVQADAPPDRLFASGFDG